MFEQLKIQVNEIVECEIGYSGCTGVENVDFVVNPYEDDVNNNPVEQHICDNCYYELKMDI